MSMGEFAYANHSNHFLAAAPLALQPQGFGTERLEEALAAMYGVEDCVAFVSGHATNVSTISTLFGHKDLIVHDSLIHNSVLEGIRLSGATRRAFPHNDLEALDALLASLRPRFERVCIIVEGIYSMDGDMAPLEALVSLSERYDAFLLIDEAHATGVYGPGGRGLAAAYEGRANIVTLHTCGKALGVSGALVCLAAPLRDRFGVILRLDYYSARHLLARLGAQFATQSTP